MNAFDIVGNTRVDLQFFAEPADMVADGFLHITIKFCIPNFSGDHGVGDSSVGVCDQHGEDIKLLRCQINFSVADTYCPAFQAEI